MPSTVPMRRRTLALLAVLAAVGGFVLRRVTAESGGTYDPATRA